MNRLSLWDKFKILIDVSQSSFWLLLILVLLIGVGFTFIQTNRKTEERNKIIYIVLSAILFLLVLVTYRSSLSHLFDYLMDHVFVAILFPSFALYFLGVIITNIILWMSLFHWKTKDNMKKVNVIVYIILSYLLVLILRVTDIEKINIFSQTSIYQNDKATALMELSSIIFVIWILFLILYKSMMVYLNRENRPRVKEIIKKVIITKTVKKLPANYAPIKVPKLVYGTSGRRVTVLETNPKHIIENYEKNLTIDDYQLLLKILKEEKSKKKSDKNQLEKDHIRAMKIEEKLREEEKYTELDTLYRSIR